MKHPVVLLIPIESGWIFIPHACYNSVLFPRWLVEMVSQEYIINQEMLRESEADDDKTNNK